MTLTIDDALLASEGSGTESHLTLPPAERIDSSGRFAFRIKTAVSSARANSESGKERFDVGSVMTSLIDAAVRADRDQFSQPDREAIRLAMTVSLGLVEVLPWVTQVSSSVGPDGSLALVFAWGGFELELTFYEGRPIISASLYDHQTRALLEQECVSPGAVRHFVVRGM